MKKKKFSDVPDEKYGIYNRYGDKTMGIFMRNAQMQQDDDMTSLKAIKQATQSMLNAPKCQPNQSKDQLLRHSNGKECIYITSK